MEKQTSFKVMVAFFLAIFLISGLLLGWLLLPFLSTLILAAVVTSFFRPVYTWMTGVLSPRLASVLTCLLIFLFLFIPIVLFVGILSKEAYSMYLMARSAAIADQVKRLTESSRILERANLLLTNFNLELTGEMFRETVSDLARSLGLLLYEQASGIASNILNFFVNFFFMLLIIFFLLIDGEKLIGFIIQLSPLPNEQSEKLIRKFREMSGAILIGNGVCGLLQGIAGGLMFAAFGLESAFLWGSVMALLAFLPIIGIGVVFIPTAVYLFLKGRIAAGIFFIVFYALLSGGVEYLFKPKLVGNRMQMHTLLVFLSIMGGLNMFGILGIVYGPLVATGFLTLTDIYHTSYEIILEPAAK